MGLRQTRGQDGDKEDEALEVQQGGKTLRVRFKATDLKPLGDQAPDESLPPEPEREQE